MKKILLILLGLVLLIIIGLVTYVSMIDWNEHKGRIASSLSELTGKKVVFNGPLSVSLLPSPQIHATQVQVFNASGDYAQKPLADIKELSAKITFSSLFGGDFDISRVSLLEPEITFDVATDGTLNWAAGGQKFQEDNIRQMQISLDSVTLENAKLHFLYPQMKIDSVLSNLNAEIIAETVFGPYRIEGSYTKGENPEGFAVSIGQIAENIATSINLAINFPTTKSYARFDGTVYFRDRKILGNIIAESEQPVDFAKDMFQLDLDKALNQKFALTAAVDSGLEKMTLSNVVIKYGKTSGAGNVLIPLPTEQSNVYYPRVEVAFNMTDFDLDLPFSLLKAALKDYPKKPLSDVRLGFDLIGDVKALKSYYNNQTINDLAVSFDVKNGQLLLRGLKGKVFNDTTFNLNGSAEIVDGFIDFDATPSFETSEFSKVLEWLGYAPRQVAPATYQKASAEAAVKGKGNQIYISSLALFVDNMFFSGDAGIVLGDTIDSMWVINADSINFDNYISPLAEADAQKTFSEKLGLLFKDLDVLNSHNLNVVFNLNKGIFRSVPFEEVKADFQLSGGKMLLNNFEVSNVYDSSLLLSGGVSGFGTEPAVEGLQYDFVSKNFSALSEKLGLFAAPNLLSKVKELSSKGVVSGNMQYLAVKTESEADKNKINYSGVIDFSSGKSLWDGELEVQSSDFVKMLNNFGIAYSPQAFSLGLFNAKGDFRGTLDNFKSEKLNLNIGANSFDGAVAYDVTSGRPKLTLNGKINRFETSRFMPENNAKAQVSFQNNGGVVNFLTKPSWSKVPFNLMPLTKMDVFADLTIDELLLQNIKVSSADVKLALNGGKFAVQSFSGDFASGQVLANGELSLGVKPDISFNLEGKNLLMSALGFGGKVFAIRDGNLNFHFNGRSILASEYDFYEGLNGTLFFELSDATVRGWNLWQIKEDISKRTSASGLKEFVLENLQSGSIRFDTIKGNLKLEKGMYLAENFTFDGSLASINVNADGNFMSWDGNGTFKVSWKEKISPFSFTWNGSLENPQVNVDVSVLTNEFDARNAQLEAERKAKEKEAQDAMKARFDEQVKQTKSLKSVFDKQILPKFDEASKMAEEMSFKRSYNALKKKIDTAVGLLDEAAALALSPQISDKLTTSIAEKNNKVASEVGGYQKELDDLYLSEVKQRLGKYNETFKLAYENVNSQIDDFNENLKAFTPRLTASESIVVLENDDEIKKLNSELNDKMMQLSALHQKSLDAYNLVAEQNDTSVLERVVVILKNNNDSVQSEQQEISSLISQMLEKAEQITAAEEQAAFLRRQEAERKKKVEEATGTIANADGKVKTIVPDIHKIEQAEAEISQEKRVVLDFSNDKENKSKEVVERKFLSVPANGEASGAKKTVSGKISRD